MKEQWNISILLIALGRLEIIGDKKMIRSLEVCSLLTALLGDATSSGCFVHFLHTVCEQNILRCSCGTDELIVVLF